MEDRGEEENTCKWLPRHNVRITGKYSVPRSYNVPAFCGSLRHGFFNLNKENMEMQYHGQPGSELVRSVCLYDGSRARHTHIPSWSCHLSLKYPNISYLKSAVIRLLDGLPDSPSFRDLDPVYHFQVSLVFLYQKLKDMVLNERDLEWQICNNATATTDILHVLARVTAKDIW